MWKRITGATSGAESQGQILALTVLVEPSFSGACQGQHLALTVFYVPHSLGSGYRETVDGVGEVSPDCFIYAEKNFDCLVCAEERFDCLIYP